MNPEIQQEIVRSFKIQPGSAEKPKEAIPVVEVGTKLVKEAILKRAIATNATAGTILTTPTNQDLYIVGAYLTVIKDATSTSTRSEIVTTQNGSFIYPLVIAGLTLTAQSDSVAVSFTHPIKVDRGVTIQVTNTTNVANITSIGGIIYFLDEVA